MITTDDSFDGPTSLILLEDVGVTRNNGYREGQAVATTAGTAGGGMGSSTGSRAESLRVVASSALMKVRMPTVATATTATLSECGSRSAGTHPVGGAGGYAAQGSTSPVAASVGISSNGSFSNHSAATIVAAPMPAAVLGGGGGAVGPSVTRGAASATAACLRTTPAGGIWGSSSSSNHQQLMTSAPASASSVVAINASSATAAAGITHRQHSPAGRSGGGGGGTHNPFTASNPHAMPMTSALQPPHPPLPLPLHTSGSHHHNGQLSGAGAPPPNPRGGGGALGGTSSTAAGRGSASQTPAGGTKGQHNGTMAQPPAGATNPLIAPPFHSQQESDIGSVASTAVTSSVRFAGGGMGGHNTNDESDGGHESGSTTDHEHYGSPPINHSNGSPRRHQQQQQPFNQHRRPSIHLGRGSNGGIRFASREVPTAMRTMNNNLVGSGSLSNPTPVTYASHHASTGTADPSYDPMGSRNTMPTITEEEEEATITEEDARSSASHSGGESYAGTEAGTSSTGHKKRLRGRRGDDAQSKGCWSRLCCCCVGSGTNHGKDEDSTKSEKPNTKKDTNTNPFQLNEGRPWYHHLFSIRFLTAVLCAVLLLISAGGIVGVAYKYSYDASMKSGKRHAGLVGARAKAEVEQLLHGPSSAVRSWQFLLTRGRAELPSDLQKDCLLKAAERFDERFKAGLTTETIAAGDTNVTRTYNSLELEYYMASARYGGRGDATGMTKDELALVESEASVGSAGVWFEYHLDRFTNALAAFNFVHQYAVIGYEDTRYVECQLLDVVDAAGVVAGGVLGPDGTPYAAEDLFSCAVYAKNITLTVVHTRGGSASPMKVDTEVEDELQTRRHFVYNRKDLSLVFVDASHESYDPTTRDWYTFVPHTPMATRWTDVYRTLRPPQDVIEVAGAVYNQQNTFRGVVGLTLSIGSLSQTLKMVAGNDDETESTAILIDNYHDLLASSYGDGSVSAIYPYTKSLAAAPRCNEMDESLSEVICRHTIDSYGYPPLAALGRSHASLLTTGTANEPDGGVATLKLDGIQYFVSITHIHSPIEGMGWAFLVFSPVSALTKDIEFGRNISVLISIAIMLVCMLICFGVLTVLLRPLTVLAEHLYRVAALQTEATAEEDRRLMGGLGSQLEEIRGITDAFDCLRDELRTLKQFVPQSVLIQHDAAMMARRMQQKRKQATNSTLSARRRRGNNAADDDDDEGDLLDDYHQHEDSAYHDDAAAGGPMPITNRNIFSRRNNNNANTIATTDGRGGDGDTALVEEDLEDGNIFQHVMSDEVEAFGDYSHQHDDYSGGGGDGLWGLGGHHQQQEHPFRASFVHGPAGRAMLASNVHALAAMGQHIQPSGTANTNGNNNHRVGVGASADDDDDDDEGTIVRELTESVTSFGGFQGSQIATPFCVPVALNGSAIGGSSNINNMSGAANNINTVGVLEATAMAFEGSLALLAEGSVASPSGHGGVHRQAQQQGNMNALNVAGGAVGGPSHTPAGTRGSGSLRGGAPPPLQNTIPNDHTTTANTTTNTASSSNSATPRGQTENPYQRYPSMDAVVGFATRLGSAQQQQDRKAAATKKAISPRNNLGAPSFSARGNSARPSSKLVMGGSDPSAAIVLPFEYQLPISNNNDNSNTNATTKNANHSNNLLTAQQVANRMLTTAAGGGLRTRKVTMLSINVAQLHAHLASCPDITTSVTGLIGDIVRGVERACVGHRGVMDGFSGDRFLISFNAVTPVGNHAACAAGCALAVAANVAAIKAPHRRDKGSAAVVGKAGADAAVAVLDSPTRRSAPSFPSAVTAVGAPKESSASPTTTATTTTTPTTRPITITAGISSGHVLVGNMGSDATKRFIILGHVVSAAAVLERLSKRYVGSLSAAASAGNSPTTATVGGAPPAQPQQSSKTLPTTTTANTTIPQALLTGAAILVASDALQDIEDLYDYLLVDAVELPAPSGGSSNGSNGGGGRRKLAQQQYVYAAPTEGAQQQPMTALGRHSSNVGTMHAAGGTVVLVTEVRSPTGGGGGGDSFPTATTHTSGGPGSTITTMGGSVLYRSLPGPPPAGSNGGGINVAPRLSINANGVGAGEPTIVTASSAPNFSSTDATTPHNEVTTTTTPAIVRYARAPASRRYVALLMGAKGGINGGVGGGVGGVGGGGNGGGIGAGGGAGGAQEWMYDLADGHLKSRYTTLNTAFVQYMRSGVTTLVTEGGGNAAGQQQQQQQMFRSGSSSTLGQGSLPRFSTTQSNLPTAAQGALHHPHFQQQNPQPSSPTVAYGGAGGGGPTFPVPPTTNNPFTDGQGSSVHTAGGRRAYGTVTSSHGTTSAYDGAGGGGGGRNSPLPFAGVLGGGGPHNSNMTTPLTPVLPRDANLIAAEESLGKAIGAIDFTCPTTLCERRVVELLQACMRKGIPGLSYYNPLYHYYRECVLPAGVGGAARGASLYSGAAAGGMLGNQQRGAAYQQQPTARSTSLGTPQREATTRSSPVPSAAPNCIGGGGSDSPPIQRLMPSLHSVAADHQAIPQTAAPMRSGHQLAPSTTTSVAPQQPHQQHRQQAVSPLIPATVSNAVRGGGALGGAGTSTNTNANTSANVVAFDGTGG